MRSMLDTYEPRIELQCYLDSNTVYRNMTLQEVLIHYCINNDIDLTDRHESFDVWAVDLMAQMYYDMKVHESREEYEECYLLYQLIFELDKIYEQVKKRFIA